MRKCLYLVVFISFIVMLLSFVPGSLHAAEGEEQLSVTVLPIRYTSVKGDVEKFRSHTWTEDGYVGGLKNMSWDKNFSDGTFLSFEGHALSRERDEGAAFSLKNEDLGSVNLNYKNFRKYYDGTGGFYHPFTTLSSNESGQDLNIDIGRIMFEISPALANLHDVTFRYERFMKNGTKSRLTWAGVKEGATTRNIAPSWQDVDEATDTFVLQGKTQMAGFDVSGEQKWEMASMETQRVEKWLSTTSVAADKKIRKQDQRPDSDMIATILKGEKWFNDDKSFLGFAYRYNKIDNSELENITETDENGNLFNFGSSAKTRVGATAENELDAHTWTGQYMANLTPHWNFSTKLRTEIIKKDGSSVYPEDDRPSNGTPDGVIDAIDYSESENKTLRWGENFSLKYSGIPHTSLYGDIELGQTETRINERQEDIDRILKWERDTITKINKNIWTLGGRVVPSGRFNTTFHIRRRFENNDYDDQKDTAGAINSAFIDALQLTSNEVATRMTWKPFKRIQGAFRYQYLDNLYVPRVQDQVSQQAVTTSHIFTYDVFVQPLDALLLNFSFSRQDVKTATPAAAASTAAQPGFNGDVNSWLFSGSYTPSEELSLTSTFNYSNSDNFNDFTSDALPLGVSNNRYDVDLSMRWAPSSKKWSIEPHYAYYRYDGSSVSEFGDYNANVAWIDFSYDWF